LVDWKRVLEFRARVREHLEQVRKAILRYSFSIALSVPALYSPAGK
jgi:hypothetical protein